MEPTRRDYDADYMTVVYAYAEGEATKLQVDGALTLYCAAVAKLPPTPTPHRSPVVGLERGAVGVSLAERRACWTCRYADGLTNCLYPTPTTEHDDWTAANTDGDHEPLPTARNCPGYEDKP